jgi:hypothetical protein
MAASLRVAVIRGGRPYAGPLRISRHLPAAGMAPA